MTNDSQIAESYVVKLRVQYLLPPKDINRIITLNNTTIKMPKTLSFKLFLQMYMSKINYVYEICSYYDKKCFVKHEH
jgi:hypothetical protein